MRLGRYGVVGLLTLAVYLIAGEIARKLSLPVFWEAASSFAAAVAFNYVLQRGWVFQDRRPPHATLPKFGVMIAVGCVINVAALTVLTPRLPHIAAQLAAAALVVVWNACLAFSWVFFTPATRRPLK